MNDLYYWLPPKSFGIALLRAAGSVTSAVDLKLDKFDQALESVDGTVDEAAGPYIRFQINIVVQRVK